VDILDDTCREEGGVGGNRGACYGEHAAGFRA
jgi:hypothetical protein